MRRNRLGGLVDLLLRRGKFLFNLDGVTKLYLCLRHLRLDQAALGLCQRDAEILLPGNQFGDLHVQVRQLELRHAAAGCYRLHSCSLLVFLANRTLS